MPTATSAAAIVITKSASITPGIAPDPGPGVPYRQNATRLILAALSMISMAMSTAMAFRLTSTPTRPIENEAAAKYRNQLSGMSEAMLQARLRIQVRDSVQTSEIIGVGVSLLAGCGPRDITNHAVCGGEHHVRFAVPEADSPGVLVTAGWLTSGAGRRAE